MNLGFSRAVAVWLDDNIYGQDMGQKNQQWIKYNKFKNFEKNPRYVTASHTLIALAYMESIFAKIALDVSYTFKMIQDKVRFNETDLIYQYSYKSIKPW